MNLYGAIFYLLGIVIVIATGLAVTRRQPIHAVLYLIVAFLSTAALLFLLGAPLLAAFMVIVYAGAIMVLVLFAIMLFQQSPREMRLLPEWGPAVLLGVVFLCVAVAMIFRDPGSEIVLKGAVAQPPDFGRFLFDRYWLAIEIVSILLLVALVAIIQLAKRKESSGDEAERRVNLIRNSGCYDSKPSGALNPAAGEQGVTSDPTKEGYQ